MPIVPQKRPSDALVQVEAKRSRNELVAATNKDKQLLESGVPRTSSLLAPIMQLEGHQGDVFSAEFHPEGQHLVSTGFDRQICKFFADPKIALWIFKYFFFFFKKRSLEDVR